MSEFYNTIISVLKQDNRFFTEDGDILRNAIYEAAMQFDGTLIRLLINNPITKERFFKEVEGIAVFDKIGFGWVINNRQFLPNSYTRFKNKIGLVNDRGDYISTINDIVLAFPYKDCILEGGQTKEEQQREEIFYNETLAPDEVDRLLYPKVFTNAIRITKEGIEEVTEFNDKDNLIIKGNNLLVLSSLLKRYEGCVKCIYIDVPYNTGNDSFGYNDKFNHSTWLTFIKNRLEISKKLLTQLSQPKSPNKPLI
ncbi:site-specific DNA-methyltransferase [Paenibacillus sp. IHB B 3415]|uniref:site-specific DNA-methyltransferase n=1 Tax=Paenibacillus sp. IHB B 3415 TaxID=867080 RepID=UPI0009FAACD3|nr:site-specific DNA-methyltransferase [Paenibacillus sp. IHB B 3415]